MEKLYIKDLSDKQTLNTHFLAREKGVHTGKNGRRYISLILSDPTGTVDARIWDNVESVERTFESGDVVKVKGQVQVYQNRLQVIVHRIEKAPEGTYDLEQILSRVERAPEDLFRDLIAILEEIRNPFLRQLCLGTVKDPEIQPKLIQCPAAKSIHHAKVGGLLEHVLSICAVMKFMAAHYRQLNEDLLIFGALFHDIGKIWELSIEGGIHYTDEGRLVGHLVMASELVEKKASRILGFPERLKILCKHIILSHHGKLEYGSPKRPKFLEAFVVSMIDDLDSKIDTLTGLMQTGDEHGWTGYTGLFDRYLYTNVSKDLSLPEETSGES